jgi:hypothetical protein
MAGRQFLIILKNIWSQTNEKADKSIELKDVI